MSAEEKKDIERGAAFVFWFAVFGWLPLAFACAQVGLYWLAAGSATVGAVCVALSVVATQERT